MTPELREILRNGIIEAYALGYNDGLVQLHGPDPISKENYRDPQDNS